MLLISLFVGLVVLGVVLFCTTESCGYSDLEEFLHALGTTLIIVFGDLSIVAAGVILPVNRADTRAWIAEYDTVNQSLSVAREQNNEAEITAIQLKVIELNQELERMQYWQKSLWINWFYDPRIAKLEPIK